MCAPSRNSAFYQDFLQLAEQGSPEIAHATQLATTQLNARARPWIWGRPQPKPRSYRRRFIDPL